ncbi:JmjC domain, hydroxylase-domain-containing protein [Xylogone sp. PMI_703]|nr:JmjC domain, hydroxylase-domain-containing protein [Xylogone sp. PMI_703]
MDDRIREAANESLDEVRNFIVKESGVQDYDDSERGEPVTYSPTLDEWVQFGTLMEKLHRMDTERVGVALVTLPANTPGLGMPLKCTKYSLNGKRFEVQVHSKNPDYFKISLKQDGAFFLPTDKKKQEPYFRAELEVHALEHRDSLPIDLWVEKFEKHIASSKIATSPVYASEKDVDTVEQRQAYQLFSESCIFPKESNLLDVTTYKAGGIHTPWLYVSSGEWIPFSMHKEDTDTVALNVLLAGKPKIWTTIAPHHAMKLERVVGNAFNIKMQHRICDNWIRELGLYIPQKTLDKHKIHYCLFAQAPNQVVITFAKAYHQGFNSGINVAEAVNYGDKHWTPTGARFCSITACDHEGTIPASIWGPKVDGHPQITVGTWKFDVVEADVRCLEPTERPLLDTFQNRQTRSLARVSKTRQNHGIQDVSQYKVTKRRSHTTQEKKRYHFTRKEEKAPSDPTDAQTRYSLRSTDKDLDNITESNILSLQSTMEQHSGLWKKWETENQNSTFKPTALFLDLSHRYIHTPNSHRHLTFAELDIIISTVTSVASAEALIQLREAIQALCEGTDSHLQDSRLGNAAKLARLLDRGDKKSHCLAIHERIYLAKFAVSIDTQRAKERSGMDIKIKTQVYENVMAEAYPYMRKPDKNYAEEWSKKYHELERRYSYGKRWFKLVNATSWYSLLLIPTGGSLEIQNQKLHKLNNDAFDIFLTSLKNHKANYLHEISERLKQMVTISLDGTLSISVPYFDLTSIIYSI